MIIFINIHIDNIIADTKYYNSLEDIKIANEYITMLYIIFNCKNPKDYKKELESYPRILKFKNLTHLWLFNDQSIKVAPDIKDFLLNINTLEKLELLSLAGGYILDELDNNRISQLDNLPIGLKFLYFELSFVDFYEYNINLPVGIEKIEISFNYYNSYRKIEKNKIQITKIPFGTQFFILFPDYFYSLQQKKDYFIKIKVKNNNKKNIKPPDNITIFNSCVIS